MTWGNSLRKSTLFPCKFPKLSAFPQLWYLNTYVIAFPQLLYLNTHELIDSQFAHLKPKGHPLADKLDANDENINNFVLRIMRNMLRSVKGTFTTQSKMELFAKILNSFQLLTIFVVSSALDVFEKILNSFQPSTIFVVRSALNVWLSSECSLNKRH